MPVFHFSPRENRAHEINWFEWGKKAFEEAQKHDKPILLAISGTWCHWCHVMDETSYSDPEVINFINEHFVPIRVDTDQRPDINERYNMGGWPTTAFLTPQGEPITGGTYIPPQQMKSLLKQINRLYHEKKEQLKEKAHYLNLINSATINDPGKLKKEIYTDIVSSLKNAFDEEYAGFGTEPKFPMADALELAAHQWLNQYDEKCGKIFLKTLDAMLLGGIYDPVEGGFFRYSTTRDWSIPHYEKMLEDNSRLLKILALAYYHTQNETYLNAVREILNWLENTMFIPDLGCWAGSQNADENYYSLSLKERKKTTPPRTDKNIYTNWNAMLADALFYFSKVAEDEKWEKKALETLLSLEKLNYDPQRGCAHYFDGFTAQVYGLLMDQVMMGRGFTTAYQHLGNKEFLHKAENLAQFCIRKLQSPEGGFYDRMPNPDELGMLSAPLIDIQQNAFAARWLLELEALTGNDLYGKAAVAALEAFGGFYREYGIAASEYALAVYTALNPWIKIEITGSIHDNAYQKLWASALKSYVPNKVVNPLGSKDRAEGNKEARAYVCRGAQCHRPATSASDLNMLIKRLATEK